MNNPAPQSANFMYIFGAIILVCVAIYFLFMAIDSLGLKEEKATAKVISKGYKQAGKTYITQIVANRPVVLPQVKPEMYILQVEIEGKKTECAVDKSLYEAINPEDQVQVVYQKRRILGKSQVLKVTR
jgi:hypothetical protein